MEKTLVYYFAFPHYRLEILKSLRRASDQTFEFISGRSTRANIAALAEEDVEGLTVTPSISVGPVSWDRRVLRCATSRSYRTVILGPATMSLTTWAVLIVRRIRGLPTYLWGQCGRYGDRSIKRRIQEVMNRLATGVLVYGENEAVAATQLGLDKSRVSIVHNATHSNAGVLQMEDGEEKLQLAQDAARRVRTAGEMRLLFVGRLNGSKRLDVLLQAATRLREQHVNLVIDLIGDGDERVALSESFPQTWIRFHGWVYDTDELHGFFQSATLVCSPYHMGLLAIDALRAGVPVLVPDNPMNGSEVEALTPMVNSVRFKAGDVDSIVAAANKWVSLVEDIEPERFSAARARALAKWDPQGVAMAIQKAIAR